MGRYENYLRFFKDIIKTVTRLCNSFIKIKKLTNDLFNTGNIATKDYCLKLYRQFTTGEMMENFLWNATEIKKIVKKLDPELIRFYKNTIKFFSHIKKPLQNKSITEEIFLNDLKKQFKKGDVRKQQV